MDNVTWTYNLRIVERSPDQIPMERFGEYVRVFAELLGADNQPVFDGVLNESTGICARVPDQYAQQVRLRLIESKASPDSRPGKVAEKLERMMGEDGLTRVELKDSSQNVVQLYVGTPPVSADVVRIKHDGTVDGQVIGIMGADDTMHLHLRDHADRVVRLVVKDEELARSLVAHFRGGQLRLRAAGFWVRTDDGWLPENKCIVTDFEDLDEMPVSEVFAQLGKIDGNGWKDMDAPQSFWASLRGIN